MVMGLINANPIVYEKKERRERSVPSTADGDEYSVEPIDQLEVFDHIRDIKDPEHPYSLEELKVITEDAVEVDDKRSHVRVTFTPTVEHCSMATVIGLCIRVKLLRSLPSRYKENGGDIATEVDNPMHHRGVQYPFSINEKVLIKGNRRTPEKFVGREAVITTQCLNGWYLLKIMGTGESVRLQYRSLRKSLSSEATEDRCPQQPIVQNGS